jgi:hypothetical protein
VYSYKGEALGTFSNTVSVRTKKDAARPLGLGGGNRGFATNSSPFTSMLNRGSAREDLFSDSLI